VVSIDYSEKQWCGSCDPRVSARMAREFGVEKANLEGARPSEEAWGELVAFLEGRGVPVGLETRH